MESKTLNRVLSALCVVAFLVLLVVSTFPFVSEIGPEVLGQRGDYFGGFLNPLLTTLTFGALISTILMQRTEVQDSRKHFSASLEAMQRQNETVQAQNYQASFFQLLTMYDAITVSIEIVDPVTQIPAKGRDAFRVMYSEIRRLYRKKRLEQPNKNDLSAIAFAYDKVYKAHHTKLSHYLRFLYNAILMIEESPDARKYLKILRAMISNQELLMLFYNCTVTTQGRNFKVLAERHALFNNIPPHLFEVAHADRISPHAFGEGGYEELLRVNRHRFRGDGTSSSNSTSENA